MTGFWIFSTSRSNGYSRLSYDEERNSEKPLLNEDEITKGVWLSWPTFFALKSQITRLINERRIISSLLTLALIINLVYLLLFTMSFVPSFYGLRSSSQTLKRNIIFMVSDGFGPASETYARSYYQFLQNGPENGLPPFNGKFARMLPLDTIMVGQSRTRSADSWVTDSAAGATAFSCAFKSYNGAIGVNTTQVPCATVMEAAKYHGMKTGIVVTSRVTHATPAAFSSHATWRDYENEIAVQQIGDYPLGRTVDLMFGGGRCNFLPKSDRQSCRKDNRNLEVEAKERFGFTKVISSRSEFDDIDVDNTKLPIMGLFHPDHMAYSIDNDPSEEPSLLEMTSKALDLLTEATRDSEKGFFLLIEGSRIDMAAHDNDPAAHVHEILAYQDAIAHVKQYVEDNPGTIMISVSDHETGGFALGRQVTAAYPQYAWFPEIVHRVQNSTTVLANDILLAPESERAGYVRNVILPMYLGIEDFSEDDVIYLSEPARRRTELIWYLGDMVSRRALLGWSTHGHSGVDVNLYAYAGQNHRDLVDSLRRNLENTELGTFMEEYLGFTTEQTLDKLTLVLIEGVKNGTLIMYPSGKPPKPDHLDTLTHFMETDSNVKTATYHGSQIIP